MNSKLLERKGKKKKERKKRIYREHLFEISGAWNKMIKKEIKKEKKNQKIIYGFKLKLKTAKYTVSAVKEALAVAVAVALIVIVCYVAQPSPPPASAPVTQVKKGKSLPKIFPDSRPPNPQHLEFRKERSF